MTKDQASAVLASRYYSALAYSNPNDEQVQLPLLVSKLEVDKSIRGFDSPLPDGDGSAKQLSMAAGPFVVERVLKEALACKRYAAAAGASEVLGEIGEPNSLLSISGDVLHKRTLVKAATHPDARVRFAALGAIAKLNPAKPFPGSNHVVQALANFATANGERKALVVHKDLSKAQNITGLLTQAGFQSDVATTSLDFQRHADFSADYEFILVGERMYNPSANQVIQYVRHNPVGRANSSWIHGATRIEHSFFNRQIPLAEDPYAIAVVEPFDEESAYAVVPKLLELWEGANVSPQRRKARAAASLQWLSQMVDRWGDGCVRAIDHYPKLADTLYTNGLTLSSAELFAKLGLAEAQVALAELASDLTMPSTERQIAAAAFAESVEKFGVLLSQRQKSAQFKKFNQLELDDESRDILESVLDSIEGNPLKAGTPKSEQEL